MLPLLNIEEGADGKSATAPSRVACLPEYFMYYNYLKRTRQNQLLENSTIT
jgi:hypothetical protein